MSQDHSFADLMDRLRAGDRDAAAEVFQRFSQRLIALARSRLDHLLRTKVDPEDVLQSVYKSFFLRQAEGEYTLDSWDSLWSLLTVITLRKCTRRREFFRAARRDVLREVGPLPETDASGADWEALARGPTPSDAACLAEAVERLMQEMSPRERDILALSLQGYTTSEISGQVARTERTVQRLLKRIRRRIEEMHES